MDIDEVDKDLFGSPFDSEPAVDADTPEPTPEEPKADAEDTQDETPEESPPEEEKTTEGGPKGEPLDPRAYAAVRAEREKVAELKARAALLEEQLNAERSGKKPEASEQNADGLFDDPDGYLTTREQQLEQRFNQQLFNQGVMLMKSMHPDYQEKIEAFQQRAQSNPALVQQMESHPFPAQFAYETGRTFIEVGDATSVADIEKRAYEKAKAELEEKYKRESSVKAASEFPKSNADARAVASNQSVLETDEEIEAGLFGAPVKNGRRAGR